MRDVVIHLGVARDNLTLALTLLAMEFETSTDLDSWWEWGEAARPGEAVHVRVALPVQEGREEMVTTVVALALASILVPSIDGALAVMTTPDDYSDVIYKVQEGATP